MKLGIVACGLLMLSPVIAQARASQWWYVTQGADKVLFVDVESIVRDGEQLAIPGRVGIVRDSAGNLTCVYSIHTHSNDRSGRIHTEGPVPATYTLGQFFAIWGMPLQTTNVAGITDKPLTAVYVVDNNTVTAFTGDPATIELTSHRHIVLQLGTPITQIPIYSWSGN